MNDTLLHKIRNNTVIIFAAQILGLILNVGSISLAARFLGVENFGKFNSLLAIVGIAAKSLDFAFNPIIFREQSKSFDFTKYISTSLIFRLIVLFFAIIIFNTFAQFFNLSSTEIILINLLSFNILFSNKFTNFREVLIIPFKVQLKMLMPMLIVVADNFILLVLTALMPIFKGGLIYFVFIYLGANIPGALILFYLLKVNYKLKLKFSFVDLKFLFRESFPLIGFVVFSFLYTQLDILMLDNIASSQSVGIYSAAIRLVLPLKLIPNAIIMTMFPLLVKNINDKSNNQKIVNFITKLFFLFSVLSVAFIYVCSEYIVEIIFGTDFLESAVVLKILFISLFFDFFSFFCLDVFTAYNKQKYNFVYIVIMLIILFLGNYFFIPKFDYVGSSISRVTAAVVGFFYLVFVLYSSIKIKLSFFTPKFILVNVLFLVSVYFANSFSFILSITILPFAFLIAIFSLKLFSNQEILLISKTINNSQINKLLSIFYSLDF